MGVEAPAYRVLAEKIADRIRSGEFQPGDKLPSIAEIAGQGSTMGIARDAYGWLVQQGWVEGRSGARYRVTAVPPEPENPRTWTERQSALEERVADLERRMAAVEDRETPGQTLRVMRSDTPVRSPYEHRRTGATGGEK